MLQPLLLSPWARGGSRKKYSYAVTPHLQGVEIKRLHECLTFLAFQQHDQGLRGSFRFPGPAVSTSYSVGLGVVVWLWPCGVGGHVDAEKMRGYVLM